jgi:translation initiation factor 2B subunit (eIF-2B alpha/beta/delta family)
MEVDNIEQEIERLIDSLRRNYSDGSTRLAEEVVNIFRRATEINNDNIRKEYIPGLKERIIGAKPAMAAIRTVAELCSKELAKGIKGENFEKFAEGLTERIRQGREIAAGRAVERIIDDNSGDKRIITCSYSSLVGRIIELCGSNELRLSVFALESRWQGRDYSLEIIDICRRSGVECEGVSIGELGS